MPKDTRNYGKFHPRFAEGGSVFPDISITSQQNQDLNARLRARELMGLVTPISPMSTEEFLRQRQIDRLSPSSGSVHRYYRSGGPVRKKR